ncbi:MAG: GNAT family N-acetyltransferase [Rhodobacteraceae bacterium]|nr:GNAT family N-acetyltransferase [Paracoccaceae bacterium]
MITCRSLSGADLAQWRPLRQEALRLYPLAFLTTLEEELARADADVAKQLDAGFSYGAYDGDTLIGIAVLVTNKLARTRHRAMVATFYVTPSHHGSGTARMLMDHLKNVAVAQDVWQMELSVARSNPRALRFYESCGFWISGASPNTIVVDGAPETDDLMICLLPNAPEGATRR